jgi:type I restriction enzyme S subunit
VKTPTVKLGEICEINPATDYDFDPEDPCSFVPMEALDDIDARIARIATRPFREVAKGYTPFAESDVIVAKITPCMENGKCAIGRRLRSGAFGSTEFHVLRATKRVIPEWLFYFWRFPPTRKLASINMTGSAGQKRVPASFLESADIPLPEMSEQQRIAGRLEQADRLCHTRRYALGLTDAFFPAAFLELFGDPIKNPHGFRVELLEDLIQSTRPISYGILMPGPDVPTGIPYIRVTDIQDGQVVTALVRRTTREIDQAYKRSKLKAGDLLLSIRGHVGRMAIVPACLDGANITQDTARLATVDTLETHYLMGCLASRGMQRRMVGLTRGAAVQGINLGDVKELPIPVPPLPLQQKFAALVERVEHLRAVQREALRQAEHLFASLLDRAFSV